MRMRFRFIDKHGRRFGRRLAGDLHPSRLRPPEPGFLHSPLVPPPPVRHQVRREMLQHGRHDRDPGQPGSSSLPNSTFTQRTNAS